jgi:hypothetical protein
MKLPTLLLVAALLTPVASSVAQVAPATSEQVIQRERDMWQAVKEHRFAPLLAALDSTSYVSVSRHGVHGKPVDAARYEWTSLDRYQLSGFETRALDSQTVIITYKADLTGMSLGIHVAGAYWMATIWRLKDGQWLAVFHSESKV